MIWLIWLDVFMSRQASNALLNIVCDIMSSLSDFLCDFPVIKSCCMGNNCDRRIPMWRLTNNSVFIFVRACAAINISKLS